MSLGQRLRTRREKLKLTNGQVATYMGVSRAHVSDMESGKSNPSLELLRKIATFYKTTTDWLLEQTDDPRPRGADYDIEANYTERESLAIVSELPDEYRAVVTRLAVALRDLEGRNRERVLGQFILKMLGDIEKRFGEEATNQLTEAIDLFARIGDDSALATWFGRYFSPGRMLPNQHEN